MPLLFFLCTLAGCSGGGGDDPLAPEEKPQSGPPYLTLSSPGTFEVGDTETTLNIVFNTNCSWSATSNQSWCRLSTASGNKGASSVKVTLESNSGSGSRSATITIKADTVSREIVIIQDMCRYLTISQKEYNVSYKGEELQVDIATNVELEVTIGSTWLKLKSQPGESAGQSGKIIFEVYPNMGKESRSIKVKIENKARKLGETITVTQDPAPQGSGDNNPGGNITDMEWN